MPNEVYSEEVNEAIHEAQREAINHKTITVDVAGTPTQIQYPFPSPGDWRDKWIYFLLIDRFNGGKTKPKFAWNKEYGFRQGGTLLGVKEQLPYLEELGVKALWLSPVLKNTPEEDFAYTYPGYNTQDFLNVDPHLASDRTIATAEKELKELINEAHARGMYVILDIVLNHTGRVFDYIYHDKVTDSFSDPTVMDAPLGSEPSIIWLRSDGTPNPEWKDDLVPPPKPDDAVFPLDLQREEFFRRRGSKLTDKPGSDGFVHGDFGTMRQLVQEFDATVQGQEELRANYGRWPVSAILIRSYQYLMSRFDIDGFRIDTVKYVSPKIVETFCNAMREYALSIGKANFFTFGEIYDDEGTIDQFIGRSGGDGEGVGMDAALDFPLFYKLPNVAKGYDPVETIRSVFETRKNAQKGRISSHGDAGRYFVSFLDNHDQNARFNRPNMPVEQVTLGLALLFCLQGIPCVYYGTEQGLQGAIDDSGQPSLGSMESVREALWGRDNAFDTRNRFFESLRSIAKLRTDECALRYGRLYFREVSGNGTDFGHSSGIGGLVAFSRILTDREVIVIANTSYDKAFDGRVVVDLDLSRRDRRFDIAYSNCGTMGTTITNIASGNLYGDDGTPSWREIASLKVSLKPMEVQILTPR